MANNYLRYFWTSIWIGVGILLGLTSVIWFSCNENLNLGLLLLYSFAYLAIGGLLGFIFSVPKVVIGTPITQNDPTHVNRLKVRYEENTNLTQVSDWLTKVLIGAGLVQMKDIPKYVLHIGTVMGRGIVNTTESAANNPATGISVAVILFFITWGFISGYLVMKLVLTEQFSDSNRDSG